VIQRITVNSAAEMFEPVFRKDCGDPSDAGFQKSDIHCTDVCQFAGVLFMPEQPLPSLTIMQSPIWLELHPAHSIKKR